MGVVELTRNAVHVLPDGALEAKLALGRPLRVKLGIDVTSPDIHVGRGIPLQRMRAFQDEGHTGVLIVGDYTTRIGDPSGRSTERPILSDEEIDRERGDLSSSRRSRSSSPSGRRCAATASGWPVSSFADVIRLTRMMTVAQMLERDDFAGRYAGGQPISVSELLYPLMQAYDSVAVEADVELGGTDQLYNLLAGREVMQAYGLEPQVVLTTPLLVAWDGEKMSSSRREQHPADGGARGAVRTDDAHLRRPARGVVPARACEEPVPDGDPLEAKLALARWIVARSHGDEAARAAEEHFTRVVREGRAPEEVPEHTLPAGDPVHLPAVLADAFGLSTSEARRLIAQGGVRVEDERRLRARPAARRARSARSCRPESGVSCASRADRMPGNGLVDRRISCATILGLPRGGCRKPVTRQGDKPSSERIRLFVVPSPMASGASQRFFVAAERRGL